MPYGAQVHQVREDLKGVPEPVRRNIEILEHYHAIQSSWAQKAIDDEAFVQSNQFTKEEKQILRERNQLTEPINCLLPAVDLAVALLTENDPKYQAVARDPSDRRQSHVWNEVLSYIWHISDGEQQLRDAVWDYFVKSRGVLMVYEDFAKDDGRGEICIRALSPFNVFPDPNSQDILWRDASDIFVSQLLTGDQVDQLYGYYIESTYDMSIEDYLEEAGETASTRMPSSSYLHPDENDMPPKLTGELSEDVKHKRYEVIERFMRVPVMISRVYDYDGSEREFFEDEIEEFMEAPLAIVEFPGGGELILEDEGQIGEVMEMAQTQGFEDPDAPGGWLIPLGGDGEGAATVTETTRSELVETGQVVVEEVVVKRIRVYASCGHMPLYDRMLPIEDYPLVPINNRHHRNPYPDSDVRYCKPLQRAINKMNAQIIAHAAFASGVKALVPRGTDKEEFRKEFAKSGMSVADYDPQMGEPHFAQAVPLGAEFYENLRSHKEQIYEIIGVYPFMMGDSRQAPETFRATMQAEENGQRRIRQRAKVIESALSQLGRVTIQLSQHHYTEEKAIRLIEPNNIMRETMVNELIYDNFTGEIRKINDLSVGRYDLVVVAGSTMPVNRWDLMDYYAGLFQMGLIDDIEALKHSDVVDAEGVLERKSLYSEMQQTIEALEQHLSDMQGQLQTREREVYHAKMQAEIEKFKRRLDEVGVRAAKAEELYTERLNDVLQQQKQLRQQN